MMQMGPLQPSDLRKSGALYVTKRYAATASNKIFFSNSRVTIDALFLRPVTNYLMANLQKLHELLMMATSTKQKLQVS
jgi:hypothetical protein